MKNFRLVVITIILTAAFASAADQQKTSLGANAALRYWSAFAQLQDSVVTDQQAKDLNLILGGTAPYADLEYRELVERNRAALETMARATAISNCDWGVDYQLGQKAPVDYVRKALALGRLNVLFTFHLLIAHDKDGAVRALVSGLRFSHDVASGGTLFATMAAKDLMVSHLRAINGVLHLAELTPAQRAPLQAAVAQLRPEGLDWQSAVKQEFQIAPHTDKQSADALARIAPAYAAAVSSPSRLPELQQMIAAAPKSVVDELPNPQRIIEQAQDLTNHINETRALLR